MRLSQAILTLAACSLLPGASIAAYTITWGNEVDSVNLSSDTASSSWASGFSGYTFQLGTFGSSFDPNSSPQTSWAANWKPLDTGTYNADAGYFAGEALLENNAQFAANEKVFVWVYKDPNTNFGGQTQSPAPNPGTPSTLFGSEWLLLTDNDWKIPAVPADQQQTLLPLAFDVVCGSVGASDIVYGGASGNHGAGDFTDPSLSLSPWCLQSHAYTTINGGNTVTLQNENVTPDSWSVTLNGGTLSTSGFNDSAGVFKLTSSSIIDFANGGTESFLNFLSTNTSGWTGKLQIWNWTGTVNTPGGVDRLTMSSHTGPSYFSGGQVQFYSDNGNTPVGWGAAFFGNEIVPVPEARTIVGILGIFGLIGWRERRHFFRCREARAAAQSSNC